MSETFDPTRHLTKVSGRDYLEVKWRLVWLRDTHPDAVIETELVQHQNQMAVFRAKVTLPRSVGQITGEVFQPGGSATGWGSEASDDFGDYLEKAETKALGRALAALGFGTQFCPDYDFGADRQRVVDSPVEVRSGRENYPSPPRQQQQAPPQHQQAAGGGPKVGPGDLNGRHYPTQNQLKFIEPKAKAAGLDWKTQANEIIFAAIGVATNNGTVNRNDALQEVAAWLDSHEGNEGQWSIVNGELILGPPGESYGSMDDVPF